MKPWGWVIAAAGVVYLFIALNMNVSVSTSSSYIPGYGSIGGGNVANFDLMARRQNHVIVASLITLIGVIIGIFGKPISKLSDGASSKTPSAEVKFEGERDLTSDSYRLWLSNKYGIERNDVFDRFVMGEKTFENLDDALQSAHESEQQKLALAEEARAAKEASAAELQAENEAIAAKAAENWERTKPKLMAGFIIFVVLAGVAFFVLKESPEEREARLAQEAAGEIALRTKIESEFSVVLPENAHDVVARNVDDYGFMCRDKDSDTMLLEFKTDSTKEEIRHGFAESLGDGKPESAYFEDAGGWNWDKDGKEWTLTIFGSEVGNEQNDVNLCLWEENRSAS